MSGPPVVLKCALSGESPPTDPVVTPSGFLCSRRLLLSKLSENGGVDPFDSSSTPRTLDESALVHLRTGPSAAGADVMPPRLPAAASLPSLLDQIQASHDAVLLELYEARSALEETRRELSQALYQNDAAVRVVARLAMERDGAREQLAAASARESACLAATWSGDLTAAARAFGPGMAESAFLSPSSDPAMNLRRAPSAALAAASVCAASPPSVLPVFESNMLDLPLGFSPAFSDSTAPTVPWCNAPAASGTPDLAAATSALVASIRLTPARLLASSPKVLMHWLDAALTASFVPNPVRP